MVKRYFCAEHAEYIRFYTRFLFCTFFDPPFSNSLNIQGALRDPILTQIGRNWNKWSQSQFSIPEYHRCKENVNWRRLTNNFLIMLSKGYRYLNNTSESLVRCLDQLPLKRGVVSGAGAGGSFEASESAQDVASLFSSLISWKKCVGFPSQTSVPSRWRRSYLPPPWLGAEWGVHPNTQESKPSHLTSSLLFAVSDVKTVIWRQY